jgi:hypothetical protein
VLFEADDGLPGQFYQVMITETADGDLIGTAQGEGY